MFLRFRVCNVIEIKEGSITSVVTWNGICMKKEGAKMGGGKGNSSANFRENTFNLVLLFTYTAIIVTKRKNRC